MTPKKVAIFWDHASCPPGDDSANDFTLAIHLREMCGEYGNVVLFKVYYGQDNNYSRAELGTDVGFALDSAGIIPVRRPEMGVSALATDALCFWADNLEAPCAIVFVTTNPTLLYTATALKSRKVEVGFISPPNGFPIDITPYSSWNREWELGKKKEHALRPSTKASSAPREPFDSKHDDYAAVDVPKAIADRTMAGLDNHAARIPNIRKFGGTGSTKRTQQVAQPLAPVEVMNQFIEGVVNVHTTVHDLQIPETEPLYISMIKDPNAMMVKTWRRQLKQMFYRDSAAKNPQAPSELETLFSKIEKYDGMTKNYLAFSRIGKLMTQISQMYYQDFDYRRGYVNRAKSLLGEWEKLIIKGGI